MCCPGSIGGLSRRLSRLVPEVLVACPGGFGCSSPVTSCANTFRSSSPFVVGAVARAVWAGVVPLFSSCSNWTFRSLHRQRDIVSLCHRCMMSLGTLTSAQRQHFLQLYCIHFLTVRSSCYLGSLDYPVICSSSQLHIESALRMRQVFLWVASRSSYV